MPAASGGFAALVLAAGDSIRMGTPKAMLRVGQEPAWCRIARTCVDLGASRVFVLVASSLLVGLLDGLPSELADKVEPVAVPDELRDRGPIGSIVHGLARAGTRTGFLLWPVDHPFVAATTIELLLAGDGDIRSPRCLGRRGHPVFVSAPAVTDLLAVADRGGTLRDLLRTSDVQDIEVADPSIHWNSDEPAQFAEWARRFTP